MLVYLPLAILQAGEVEAERVEAGHAQAQVGDDQAVAYLVVAQHAVAEPGQALVLGRVEQLFAQLDPARQALQLRRRGIQPADQGFVVVLAVQHDDAPQQGIERRRSHEQLFGLDALTRQFGFHALLGHELAGHAEADVERRHCKGNAGDAPAVLAQPGEQADHHGGNQRQGVQRVDDEQAGPGRGCRHQRPEKLGAVAGEGIQQRVGDQHQPERQEQASVRIAGVRAVTPDQPGQQQRQAAEHEQRVAEAAVIGHVAHGIAVIDDHVQIGQGGEGGTVQQRLAPLPATEQGALDAGAEHGLGYRIHRLLSRECRPLR